MSFRWIIDDEIVYIVVVNDVGNVTTGDCLLVGA